MHAALADARMWEPLIPWFQGHEPISYDLRGHGQMDEANDDFHHVDDLLGLLGEQPAVLVGAGMGARVALEAAVLAPELVLGLVLLAPQLDDAPPPRVAADARADVAALVGAMERRARAVQAALEAREAPRVLALAERLEDVRCPALLVAGELDAGPGPAAVAAGLGVAVHRVPGAAGLPALEAPEPTGRLVERFLQGLSR